MVEFIRIDDSDDDEVQCTGHIPPKSFLLVKDRRKDPPPSSKSPSKGVGRHPYSPLRSPSSVHNSRKRKIEDREPKLEKAPSANQVIEIIDSEDEKPPRVKSKFQHDVVKPSEPVKLEVDVEPNEVILYDSENLSEDEPLFFDDPIPRASPPAPNLSPSNTNTSSLVNNFDGLSLTQHGESAVGHSAMIPIDYSNITDLLPEKLQTTSDYLIAHFCKQLRNNSHTVQAQPSILTSLTSKDRHKARRTQVLRHVDTLHLGGAVESLGISSLGVIATSAPKGGSEEDLPTDPDPYNRPNNLAMYSFQSKEAQYLNRHVREWGEEGNKLYKYYSVSNVAIDSSRPDSFYSVGEDKCIRHWKLTNTEWKEVDKKRFDKGSPFHVEFHKSRPLLAVGCLNGALYYAYAPYDTGITYHPLNLINDESAKAGNLIWGTGPTNLLLFACVESLDETSRATSKYFDVTTKVGTAFTKEGLDNNVMTMTNQGDGICLSVENREKQEGEILFFDIRTTPKPIQLLSSGSYTSDVSTMAFSPDDIYLALGREDNTIEVWDTRFVSSTPFLKAQHFNGSTLRDETYGIARHLQWVERRHRFGTGLGLVTGGDGGCVRLWDIQRASGESESKHILAECPFSVSTLLIPEPGVYPEVRLITGDVGGNVTLYQ